MIRTATTLAATLAALLAVSHADADGACTEATVRDRLEKMLHEFKKPEVRAKMDAAKKDWDEDGDFDNEETRSTWRPSRAGTTSSGTSRAASRARAK